MLHHNTTPTTPQRHSHDEKSWKYYAYYFIYLFIYLFIYYEIVQKNAQTHIAYTYNKKT